MVDNARLPEDVERGAQGGPGFKTTVITLASGHENRNQEWSDARGRWNVGYGIRTRLDMQEVIDFFYARRGRARAFRFRDWLDYKVEAQAPRTTGNNLTRQLVARYGVGDNEYVRDIRLVVAGTLKVYVDGFLSSSYTEENGLLTFASNPGANVLASFEFDVPVRFDADQLNVTLEHFDAGSIPSIPIIEVLE